MKKWDDKRKSTARVNILQMECSGAPRRGGLEGNTTRGIDVTNIVIKNAITPDKKT